MPTDWPSCEECACGRGFDRSSSPLLLPVYWIARFACGCLGSVLSLVMLKSFKAALPRLEVSSGEVDGISGCLSVGAKKKKEAPEI